jgi:predicted molibdopterin-dependent oxidoreductase YjgC
MHLAPSLKISKKRSSINYKQKNHQAMVKYTINGLLVEVAEGTTILEAAKKLNFKIPVLCHHDDLCVAGNCRYALLNNWEERRCLQLVPPLCLTVCRS